MIFDGKNYRDLTPEEIAQREAQAKVEAYASRHAQMTPEQAMRMLIAPAVQTVPEAQAVRMLEYAPEWADLIGQTVSDGYRFTHNGKMYRTIGQQTFMVHWIPGEGTESLYARVYDQYAGTQDDPVMWEGNATLEKGKYYTESPTMDPLYLCTNGSGNPVQGKLADLGVFVQEVSEASPASVPEIPRQMSWESPWKGGQTGAYRGKMYTAKQDTIFPPDDKPEDWKEVTE